MKNGMFGKNVFKRLELRRVASGVTAFFLAWFALMLGDVSASDAILIDFSSAHCGACRTMDPVISELERQGVPVRHVDVDAERTMAVRYGIRQTPTFVVVSSGKEVTRLVGAQSFEKLRRALDINPAGPLIPTGADMRNRRTPAASLSPNRLQGVGNQNVSLAAAPRNNRLQTSEAMPSVSLATAVERAQAATVRLKVHDGNGHGYGAGTGTIIDTHGDEALVLTCGHLFRENKGQGKVEVDLFVRGQVKTVLGKVVDYDADNRDIALVAIRPGFAMQPVPLLSKGMPLQTGRPVFSFGCDRGDDPSRRDTRITGVDKYNTHLGASNIEIAGAPIDGRSGGGLFDDQGRLIGVCNAADYKGDVGIYTGPGSIQWQLDRVNLSNLYQPAQSQFVGNTQPSSQPNPAERIASLPGRSNRGSVVQAANIEPIRPTTAAHSQSRHEVIVIVRDPNNPNGQSKVMTVHQPTADLMQMIEQQSR